MASLVAEPVCRAPIEVAWRKISTPLKKPSRARKTNEFTAVGAASSSRSSVSVPHDVSMVAP